MTPAAHRPAGRLPTLAGAAVAVVLLIGTPGGAAPQEPLSHPLQVVSPHAHGTAVAVALRFPVGSQDDPVGLEGTAWMLAAVLQAQVNEALRTHGTVFTASVERASTVFTLLAEPAVWDRAWAAADSVLFRAPLDPARVEAHKAALLARMTFEAGSPVRDFEAEAARLLTDPAAPFARPGRGTRTSVPALGLAGLEAFRSAGYLRRSAALAVVGPVRAEVAGTAAGTPSASDLPWNTGERRHLVQDVTSAWIAVAYPVPGGLPRTHLEMVAHLIEEELDPTPPDPERYAVEVGIEQTPRGLALVVQASVFPEAAERWEARILRIVDGLAGNAIGEDFFRWRRRRFRAARLLEEAAPEVEARRLTADLLAQGRARDLGLEIWELDAAGLQDAVRRLGPPRILVLGPDLGEDRSGSR